MSTAGVQSTKDIVVVVRDTSIAVSVPGRYKLVGCPMQGL